MKGVPQPPLASARDFRVWMQEIEDRLNRLEGARSVVVGGWVLAESDTGAVELTRVSDGLVVHLAP